MLIDRATDDPVHWLPDFCRWQVIAAWCGIAELVLLIIVLAPTDQRSAFWPKLSIGSLFLQWVALTSGLALCQAKRWLARQTAVVSVASAYGLVLSIVIVASFLAFWLDHLLHMGYIAEVVGWKHFIASNTLIASLVVALTFRYFWMNMLWRNGVRGEAKAQLIALQARIRPHFLFNSMNTIASLIRARPAEAERAVEDLSDLFRAALNANESLTTIAHEIALVRRYLAIEHLRLGEKLRVDWRIDDIVRDWPVPSLLLQPLAENAVLHGIQSLVTSGTIVIRVAQEERELVVEIDNPYNAPELGGARDGNRTALENARQRLAFHYGERASLRTDARDGHYRVTLSIPRP